MSSAAVNEERNWKMIWKINAPGKMKIHLWRFAHDCLPSGVQLRRRHVPASDACIFCGRDEDVEHAFLQCQFAMEVWRTVKQSFNIQLVRRDFMSLNTGCLSFWNVRLSWRPPFLRLDAGTFGMLGTIQGITIALQTPSAQVQGSLPMSTWLYNIALMQNLVLGESLINLKDGLRRHQGRF
jgi:hypothetical protein